MRSGQFPVGGGSRLVVGGYVCSGMVLKFGRARLNHVLSTISTISQKTTGLIETKHLSFFQIDWAIAYRLVVLFLYFDFFQGRKISINLKFGSVYITRQ